MVHFSRNQHKSKSSTGSTRNRKMERAHAMLASRKSELEQQFIDENRTRLGKSALTSLNEVEKRIEDDE